MTESDSDIDSIVENLTSPQPLDVEAETHRLFYTMGIVQSLCIPSKRPNAMTPEQAWDVFYRRVPFIKALGELARRHPDETRELWKEALLSPMPFGGAPLGLPDEEKIES